MTINLDRIALLRSVVEGIKLASGFLLGDLLDVVHAMDRLDTRARLYEGPPRIVRGKAVYDLDVIYAGW